MCSGVSVFSILLYPLPLPPPPPYLGIQPPFGKISIHPLKAAFLAIYATIYVSPLLKIRGAIQNSTLIIKNSFQGFQKQFKLKEAEGYPKQS